MANAEISSSELNNIAMGSMEKFDLLVVGAGRQYPSVLTTSLF